MFLLVFGVYLKTLAPHLYVGDSSELITAAKLLGVAHPTSYPLYVLLGKIFSLIPLSSPAFTSNLFSAATAALSVVTLCLVFENVGVSQSLSIGGSLIFAFSLTFWSQAVISRVYCLNLLLTCLVLYAIFSKPNILLAFFLLGLGAANHYFIWLITPLLLVYSAKNYRLINYKKIILMLLPLLLAFFLYLELPIRANANVPQNWHSPDNITRFLDNVLQRTYAYKKSARPPGDILWLGYNLLLSLGPEFFYFGSVFVLVGLVYWFKKDKWYLLSIWAVVLGNFILITLYGKPREFHLVYFLPLFLMFCLILVTGLQYLKDVLAKHRGKPIIFLSFFLVICQIYLNYYPNNRRRHYLIADFSANILNSLPKDALLYIIGDSKTFSVAYQNLVDNKRPDLLFVSIEPFPEAKAINYQLKYGFRKKIFYTYFRYLIAKGKEPYTNFTPTGLLWQKINDPGVKVDFDPTRYYRRRELNDRMFFSEKSKGILNYYNLNKASQLIMLGKKSKAKAYLELILKFSGRDKEALFQAGRLYMKAENTSKAYKCFYKASIINPFDLANLQNLASMAQLLKKSVEALSIYQKILRIDENNYRARYNLGYLYASKGDFNLARYHLERFLKIVPPIETRLIEEVKKTLAELPK